LKSFLTNKTIQRILNTPGGVERFAAEMADKCEIQLAYAIGVEEPISINVDTYGTGRISEEKIIKHIKHYFDFTPKGIIERFDMLKPIYYPTAFHGHFGNPNFPWEHLNNEFTNLLRW